MDTTCKCQTQFCKHRKAQVWSCGGGTQSCAIAALIVQGKLPKPDFSVIADTGYETGATWEFMDRVLVPELRKVGVELVRISSKQFGDRGEMIFTKSSPGPLIPVFSTINSGSVSKLSNFCTHNWKLRAINRWLFRVHNVNRKQQRRWIGFSKDEQRRWVRGMNHDDYKNGLSFFPLVEAIPTTRREAIAIVESMGWGIPPRSSCWMCPNHSDHEWRKLIAERPDEFQKAVELEREIHKVDPDAWLHRSCVPLDQVDFSQPEDLFSRPCDSGMCFV